MATLRPSLNALRAFEASARLGSMSQAATELGVTPGAVSRHVVALEDMFGQVLLKRLPQSVTPTPEGARMAATLAEAFHLIDQAIAQLEPGPLTLSCSSTIMMHWLIPRLRNFKQLHPEVELRLHVDYADIDLVREEVSVAIRNDMVAPPSDVIVKQLMSEEIGLVGSPEYFTRSGVPKRLEELAAEHRILGTKTRPTAWSDWFDAVGGGEPPGFKAEEMYEHFYLMIQAATFGLGVAVAPRLIVEQEISSGRLAAPLGFVPSKNNLVLWIAPHLRNSNELRQLVAWLTEQAALQRPVA